MECRTTKTIIITTVQVDRTRPQCSHVPVDSSCEMDDEDNRGRGSARRLRCSTCPCRNLQYMLYRRRCFRIIPMPSSNGKFTNNGTNGPRPGMIARQASRGYTRYYYSSDVLAAGGNRGKISKGSVETRGHAGFFYFTRYHGGVVRARGRFVSPDEDQIKVRPVHASISPNLLYISIVRCCMEGVCPCDLSSNKASAVTVV